MKSLVLLPSVLLLAACCTDPDMYTYQQVMVTPCCNQGCKQGCKQSCKQAAVPSCCRQAKVVSSCCQQQIRVINEEPIDVTTTSINYY